MQFGGEIIFQEIERRQQEIAIGIKKKKKQ